jgi:flagellar motor switch protein FliN/FliY
MTAEELAPLQKFIDLWKDAFAAVLGQLGVATPAAYFTPPAALAELPADELEKNIWGRFSVSGALQGELMLLVEKPVALQFAQLLMSEPLNAEIPFEDTHRDAFAELLRQVAGQAATFWTQDSRTEIKINFEATPTVPFAPSQSTNLRVSGEKLPELSIHFLLNAEICTTLAKAPAAAPATTAPESATASVQDATVEEEAPLSATGSLPQNLEILLDVELEATIRFGQREMLLRDIFGLMPGAVVELTQFVNEPADLLVAGRCIARGEVVVVDGNFGLRVTEVASPGQRAELIQV